MISSAKFLNTSQPTPNCSECVFKLKVLFINWQKILKYIYLNSSELHVLATIWLSYSDISILGERETSRRLDLTATKINFFSFSGTWFWMAWLFSANWFKYERYNIKSDTFKWKRDSIVIKPHNTGVMRCEKYEAYSAPR